MINSTSFLSSVMILQIYIYTTHHHHHQLSFLTMVTKNSCLLYAAELKKTHNTSKYIHCLPHLINKFMKCNLFRLFIRSIILCENYNLCVLVRESTFIFSYLYTLQRIFIKTLKFHENEISRKIFF